MTDNKCHYWYYYSDKDQEDYQEVHYFAPKNHTGIKPRFMDIWHPDEGIGIATINSAIWTWAQKHLGLEDCHIELQNEESFEEYLTSFKANEELFGGDPTVEARFTDELIEELSQLWNKSKNEVLNKLEEHSK